MSTGRADGTHEYQRFARCSHHIYSFESQTGCNIQQWHTCVHVCVLCVLVFLFVSDIFETRLYRYVCVCVLMRPFRGRPAAVHELFHCKRKRVYDDDGDDGPFTCLTRSSTLERQQQCVKLVLARWHTHTYRGTPIHSCADHYINTVLYTHATPHTLLVL